MTTETTNSTDSRNYGKVYKQQTPDILKVWGEFNNVVFSEDREIPVKYLELIASTLR